MRSRREKRESIADDEGLKRKVRILAVLARAADDSQFLARLDENPSEALSEYYTLTQEEMAALASGDIEKIESWLGKLDKRHATWLWHQLKKEKRVITESKGGSVSSCPIGFEACYPSFQCQDCMFWRNGRCDCEAIMAVEERIGQLRDVYPELSEPQLRLLGRFAESLKEGNEL